MASAPELKATVRDAETVAFAVANLPDGQNDAFQFTISIEKQVAPGVWCLHRKVFSEKNTLDVADLAGGTYRAVAILEPLVRQCPRT